MSLYRLAQVGRKLAEPLSRPLIARVHRERFLSASGNGAHHGVFSDFEAARAHIPQASRDAFDAAANVSEYIDVRSKRVFAYDYPVIWWLQRAFEQGAATVLDIGGSVGVHYYAYQKYVTMPDQLAWEVIEVPAIAGIGQELAIKNGASALTFTDDVERGIARAAHDIWLSSGTIQYIEDARPSRLLKGCGVRPKHILLNKLPLYNGADFVTVQNVGGGAYVPSQVYNAGRFIQEVEALGYTLIDRWDVHERSMFVPGHPERSFPSFSGLYFVDSDSPLAKRSHSVPSA